MDNLYSSTLNGIYLIQKRIDFRVGEFTLLFEAEEKLRTALTSQDCSEDLFTGQAHEQKKV